MTQFLGYSRCEWLDKIETMTFPVPKIPSLIAVDDILGTHIWWQPEKPLGELFLEMIIFTLLKENQL